MALLTLNQVRVRLARVGGTGSDPAPDGLNVHLDVPGGTFQFQQFIVTNPQGNNALLRPVDTTGGTVRLDTQFAYWTLWSTTAIASVPNAFQDVQGFGYPLPARWVSGNQLILPNTLDLGLRMFNVSGFADNSGRITQGHQSATDFFAKLHIRLVFTDPVFQAPPPGVGPWFLRRSSDPARLENFGPAGTTVSQPNFTQAPWSAGNMSRQLLGIWIKIIEAANGLAQMTLPILGNSAIGPPGFTLPHCGIIFVSVDHSHGTALDFAHEIGHCLLHDPGIGREKIELVPGGANRVKQFLARLGIEGPPPANPPGQRVYDSLFPRLHAPRGSGNFMEGTGGSQLREWQVAVMREAPEVRWRP